MLSSCSSFLQVQSKASRHQNSNPRNFPGKVVQIFPAKIKTSFTSSELKSRNPGRKSGFPLSFSKQFFEMSKTNSASKEIHLLLVFFCFFLGVNSQVDLDSEQNILLKLKKQWRNPPFISSWNSSNSAHCNWPGITCINGSVTGIELIEINITDEIPPFICDLQNLADINLSLNYIPGEFPTSLYNCSKLQTLDISQNYFVGRIPSDINRISTLRVLNLGANNFTGDIPPSIGDFPVLQSLQLFQNQFNGTFPPEIGNLSNLQKLELAYNQFIPSRIPSEFGRLKKLRRFWMTESNLIGEIPQSIGALTNLETMDLSSNRLSGAIPENLFQLKNLTSMLLQYNRLSGEIPRKIETWNLIEIDLSINILTGTIPEDFGKLQFLTDLRMYANRLTGEIPASITKIPSLINIQLFRNNLTGSLPEDLGLHSKLEEIDVSGNQLTGNLPETLCAGGMFSNLKAFSNNLTGTLPKSLLNCSSLSWVALYQNKFSGEIPAEFWSQGKLFTVMLRDNSFSGEFPDEMGADFERIDIPNNRFSGKIPSKIAALKKLKVFIASNNSFSGEIPVELTAISSLNTLLLDVNSFSGQFPSRIISWRSLNVLNLSTNQLSGVLPPAIGFLPSLDALDLSENQFVGEIPSEIGSRMFPFLNLSSNRLTGRIPGNYENLAYNRSFLNNPDLCADSPGLSLDVCFVESKDSRKLSSNLRVIVIISTIAVFLVFILVILYVIRDYRRKGHGQDLAAWKLTSFQRLDFTEVKILSSLTENNVIGRGGAGKVYRVLVNQSGNSYVAVKKIWNEGKLDQKLEKEFQTEVQILGTIRHSNIVKLLCCISGDASKILVYEYMENSSLDQWLYRKKQGTSGLICRNVLDWPKRLDIAVGAAQGLSYLHHNCSPPIVHRDVKSSNILLDSEFKARIADFGLAKMLVKHGENTASVIAGSFGYIAPEYGHTRKINEKIDVYSFGVVLLELATGREPNDGDEHTCLADWAWRQYQEGRNLDDALDEDVKEPCYLDEMRMVFKLGLICTGSLPSTRPTMKEILQILLRHDPMRAYRDKKLIPEYDVAPLLNDSTDYLSSYKGSKRMKTSLDVDDDDDDDETSACNV